MFQYHYDVSTQQTTALMKTSWKLLSSSSSEDLFKTSSRRLDKDEYVRLSHTSSENIFKWSSRDLGQTNIFVLVILLQDIFKTCSRRLAKTFSRCLKDIFKTSSRCFEDVFKTSSRHLQDILPRRLQDILKMSLKRYLQDVFKTYHQVKLFLLTRLRDVFPFNIFLRRTAKVVICKRTCLGHTSEKFMVSVQTLQEW